MGYTDKSQPSFNDWMSQNGVTSDMYNGYDYTGEKYRDWETDRKSVV